jgi:hypothetical protein
MVKTREVATAAGTLACAVGIGFIMQSGEAAEQRYGGSQTASLPVLEETDIATVVVDNDTLLEVKDITLTSAETETLDGVPTVIDEPVVLASVTASTLEAPTIDAVAPIQNCEITATGFVKNAAMVEVSMSAPCLPNERVTVHHRGMMFTQTTSSDGTLTATIPALDENALFIFAFSNGDGAVTQIKVPELRQFNRSAIQWKGYAGFEMHAREFGAEYGAAGHVWSGAARNSSYAQQGVGFLTRLGDMSAVDPLMAEVYSFPKRAGEQSGIVDLSVEAEVTALNCGQEIEAQTLEVTDGDVKTHDLILSVPDCDAKDTFLVLNNLVQDLKVAAN